MRQRTSVRGDVQGVGFRPFVWNLAVRHGLTGWVANDAAGVVVEVEGPSAAVAAFTRSLLEELPPLATVSAVEHTDVPEQGGHEFAVRASLTQGPPEPAVAADARSCPDCLAEVEDPADRRYGYPLSSCTRCGPRYSVVTGLPYDRARTTLAAFPLCADCRREHDDPQDRRFHAQGICCPACGPRLTDDLTAAVEAVRAGQVLALKGLGGYQLVALASHEGALHRLREAKQRPHRPFAVLVADLDAARQLCEVDAQEAQALTSSAGPIVLLRARTSPAVHPLVAPGLDTLGLLLPTTPLHHLLVRAVGAPVVLTSGNRHAEPLLVDDDQAWADLRDLATVFLRHDRPVVRRLDDSVVQVVEGEVVPLRRARGYAPRPVRLQVPLRRPTLAVGGQQKVTVAAGRGDRAWVSQHLGDLGTWAGHQGYLRDRDDLLGLLSLRPEVVAHDLHPEYVATREARVLHEQDPSVELVGVQHHHAHVASCLVDNGHAGPVLGVAFDGAGLGPDGSIWGGEVLRADLRHAERVGHLRAVDLPGGDAAVRAPWRMALSYLAQDLGAPPPLDRLEQPGHEDVLALVRSGLAPKTSSAGRLFDAVAAVLGIRGEVSYEGQAAVELEQAARRCGAACPPYDVPLRGHEVDGPALVRAVLQDVLDGRAVDHVAHRFHTTLAEQVADLCDTVADGLGTVALTGGVFQNGLLLTLTRRALRSRGFAVLTHRTVPCNDGGLSLGQLAVAAALDSAGRA